MGNSCNINTIIEKNNINDRYVFNKKNIHIWPELQNQNIHLVKSILSNKGYDVLITTQSNYNCRGIYYNRIVLYIENGLVKNIPRNG